MRHLKSNSVFCLAVAAAVLPIMSSCAAGVRMDRSKLLIGAYCLNRAALDDAHMRDIRECGVDFIVGYVDIRDRSTLDLFAKHGIGMVGKGVGKFWWGGNGSEAGMMRKKCPRGDFERDLAAWAGNLDHPAVWMLNLADEPSALDLPYLGELCDMLSERAPKSPPYLNLYPNYAVASKNSEKETRSQLGTATYAQYVDEYCRDVPIDILTFDYYPYRDNTNNVLTVRQPQMYDNFNVVAKACRRTGRAFWFIAQVVTPPKNTKRLTEENFWFQGLVSMAFGTECVRWALWHHGWWTNSVITVEGVKSDHFEKLTRVNAGLHRIGAPYMRFRNVDTVFTGFGGGIKDALGKVGIESRDDFSNGFVQALRAEDGSPLVIGEMVSRDLASPRRALFVFAAGDMLGIRGAEHVVRFRADLKRVKIDHLGSLDPDAALCVDLNMIVTHTCFPLLITSLKYFS